jgi:hypothetical protein
MSLDVTHMIWGYLYDADGNTVAGATVSVQSTSYSGLENTVTTASGYYQLNVMDICEESDLIVITFTSGSITQHEFVKVKLDELTQEVSSTLKNCFKFESDSYSIYMQLPDYTALDRNTSRDTSLFNFYSNQISVTDNGKESEPLALPIKAFVDVRTRDTISGMIEALHLIANDGEEITIDDINSCFNGVYIIKNIRAEPVRRTSKVFQITLTLEFKRDI